MNAFLVNLALAVVWAALTGSADAAHLWFGFGLGFVILWLLEPLTGSAYHAKLPRTLALVAFFLWELVVSTLRVAREVVTPTRYRHPGIVGVPLDASSDLEISLLAILVTLTPGTLGIDVSEDRRVLWVHAMFVEDPDTIRREIKDGSERRLLQVTR